MLKNREGERAPQVTFKTRKDNQWVYVDSEGLFSGKRVVVFSLPGAFTPTCSSSHVPRYNELAPAFVENGIDEIICISVNDGFVMEAWQKDQNAENITFIPDGNGEFTEAMGMLVDKNDLGFGKRSWRYSMLVDDGVVKKMFIEPEVEGDPFKVSDADTMLAHINPNAQKPRSVALFSKIGCPHCLRAKALLTEKGFAFEEIVLGKDATNQSLRAMSGAITAPQVFIDGKLIGSADDLEAYFAQR